MKLRNKKTGMIGEVGYITTSDGTIVVNNIDDQDEWYDYESLAELNEEWEDAPEPKRYWFIENDGEINSIRFDDDSVESLSASKDIGNYFETEEEAEKAVEKLKALKRLKDTYYLKFDLDFVKNTISFTYRIDGTLHSTVNEERIIFEDMKTIFGGEE